MAKHRDTSDPYPNEDRRRLTDRKGAPVGDSGKHHKDTSNNDKRNESRDKK